MNLSSLSSEIDLETTLDRMCGDHDLLLEILDMFLAEFTAERANLQAQVEKGDFANLATKAHYFKGVAQNLGLLKFSPQVKRLEESAKQNDLVNCQQAVEELADIARQILALRQCVQST
jgi:HPt (histidine-containing phosphotransfer) domain-containing protein